VPGTGGALRLDPAQVRHLRALRLCSGAHLLVFDDQGREHSAVLRRIGPRSAEIEIRAAAPRDPQTPALTLVLIAGILKGQRMDTLVEKATELGVSRIVPAITTFTVARPSAPHTEKAARWRRIAVSAATQCGRATVPDVAPPTPLGEALAGTPRGGLAIVLWERERGVALGRLHAAHPRPRTVTLAVGPEGGFSSGEVRLAAERGFAVSGLGPRILRAETAGIVALALCQLLWGDLAGS
jgi:16S rRNA (uracil1498-N3)-methyltransferase